MTNQTPSQVAMQYVLSAYSCLPAWIDFVQNAFTNLTLYSPTACSQISSICQATMKTIEFIQQNESSAKVVRVMLMLDDLYNVAWQGWTAFAAQTNISTGSQILQAMPDTLSGLESFRQWDAALVAKPSFDPPTLLSVILGGVTI